MRGHRSLAVLTAAAALAVPAAARADAVRSGSLSWSLAHVYDTGAPDNTNRTYLGYVTSSGPPFTNGTARPSNGATGDTVTPSSAKGADKTYAFRYAGATGTYDRITGAGTLELKGTVTFHSDVHGFTITIVDPLVTIGADKRGTLAASGQTADRSSGAAGTYDRSTPVFDLDLSRATVTPALDGSTSITGIVPAVKTDIFSGYPPGSGPDRTPNTFGAFALTVSPNAASDGSGAPPTPTPAEPAASPVDKAPAKASVRGANRGATVVLKLNRDIANSARKTYAVHLRRNGRTVATGSLHKRLLTLRVKRAGRRYPLIRGAYKLVPASRKVKFGPVRLTVS